MKSSSQILTKLGQLEIFTRGPKDSLKSDFQGILRMIPSGESDYTSHNIHPYPAKFLPHYPSIFIKHLTKEGDVVVDPMCGAGTSLIEACLAKRMSYGMEIDPIAYLISKVSVTPLKEKTLKEYETILIARLQTLFAKKSFRSIRLPTQEEYPNYDIWFREDVLKQLLLIRDTIHKIFKSAAYKNFALLCLSSIVRQVSNADPRDIFPQRDRSQKVRAKKDVLIEYRKAFKRNKKRLLEFSIYVPYPKRGRVTFGDARQMPYENNFANLVFTSPPYAYAIDYARVHQLSTLLFIMANNQFKLHRRKYIGTDRVSLTNSFPLHFDGFKFAKEAILNVLTKDKKCGLVLHNYFRDMAVVTKECYRIVKPGGCLVYVIGNSTIKKTPFFTDEVFISIAKEVGFRIERTLKRPYYAYRMSRARNIQSNTIKSDVFIIARK